MKKWKMPLRTSVVDTTAVLMKIIVSIIFLIAGVITSAKAKEADIIRSSKAAISYLEMLNSGDYNLTDNTALSSYCSSSRITEIKTQLAFYKKTSLSHGDKYQLIDKKVLGSLAAVIIRAENQSSPLNTHIHALAMVEHNGTWLPAPLPGSFTNTISTYELDTEKATKNLEQWMAKEKNKYQTNARNKASNKLLSKVSQEAEKIDLKNITPEQLTLELIHALRSKDTPKSLAILGVASDVLAPTLETLTSKLSNGLKINSIDNEWTLVKDAAALVQIMHLDTKNNKVAVGFWNPLVKTEKRAAILYFPFYKSEGKTFLKLPKLLSIGLLSRIERLRQRRRLSDVDRNKLLSKLPEKILQNTAVKTHTDKETLLTTIIGSPKKSEFLKLISLLPREAKFLNTAAQKKESLEAVSELLVRLQTMQSRSMLNPSPFQNKNIALAPLHVINPHIPEEFTIINIWMIKLEKSWHLIPERILAKHGGAEINLTIQKLLQEMRATQKAAQAKLLHKITAGITSLSPPLQLPPPSEALAKETLFNFFELLKSNKIRPALHYCAALDNTSNQQILKTSSYLIRGKADQATVTQVLGYHQTDNWAALSLKTHPKSSDKKNYPLYLIVNTAHGCKVLLDIELHHSTNKGQELLNKKAWEKLTNSLPKESLSAVQALFKKHTKLSSQDITQNTSKAKD